MAAKTVPLRMALPLSYGDTVSCQLAACTGVTESGAAGSGGQFSRCYSKLCALHPSDSESSKTEMNLLFDQLISENYTNNYGDNANISPADVCALLLQASRLVPFSQEHLVSKLCQLIHHLLNRLQLLQNALKGMQCSLNGGKLKLGLDEQLGSLLAALKKYMFFGLPGMTLEIPAVLYPAPLPQYEGSPSSVKPEMPQDTHCTPRQTGNKRRKSRGRSRKAGLEGKRDEEAPEAGADPPKEGAGGGDPLGWGSQIPKNPGSLYRHAGQDHARPLYPLWKKMVSSSDSEFSDPEGSMQSKMRLYQAKVRQGALHCFLSTVKCVEKKVLYGYWSSFIPDAPGTGSPPSLTLLTIVLKDPSPKARAGALQVLSAMLEGSRQFLSAAEDTSAQRRAFTPFSATLAAGLRELHRCLLLALLAESSSQTLTQVIKCLATLVSNAPYSRLRPGLLSPLWRQIKPYIRHRGMLVFTAAAVPPSKPLAFVLAHLVKGYFSIAQSSILQLGEVSAQCLKEADPSIQLHGAKLLEELGSGTIQQYKVKSNAVRALGNLLHFLQPQHVSRPSFAGPLEEAVRALIGTVGGDATMKVRWNACYALGNAFRNPALPLGTAPWTSDAYSALTGVVKSCKNFKVRIKSAMALAVPGSRERYGSDEQFGEVWAALALALERSEDTEDFLEYRYCASLRAQLCQALLHLLGLARPADLPRIRTSLAERGPAIRGYLARYHTGGGEGDDPGECPEPRERMRVLEGTLGHLRNLSGDDGPEGPLPSVVPFLEDILKSCKELSPA
nr:PREDICTED: HEAT repeat-containing protein 6 [Lepisosteus oculatus]